MSGEEKSGAVKPIGNGTVIDHICAGTALKCLKIINPQTHNVILIGMNKDSRQMLRKDFIKLENTYLTADQADKIALLAPNATINLIKNSKVVEKRKVSIPNEITGTLRCLNPTCASNTEKYLSSSFSVKSKNPLILKCKYCGRHLLEADVRNQL